MFYLLLFGLLLGGSSLLTARLVFQCEPHPRRSYLTLAAIPVLFLAYWVALTWALSLPGFLNRWSLLAMSAALFGLIYAFDPRPISWKTTQEWLLKAWASKREFYAFLPLMGAGLVFLWKGWVLPTCNTDALYLHLPRAVWITKSGGFPLFQRPQPEWGLHASYPLNYEGLLAGIITLTSRDTYTEWLTTLTWAFLLLIVVAWVGLFYERTNRRALATLLLLYSSIPVLILHGAADKVDLGVAVAFASSLFWLYWWAFEDTRLSTLLLAWSGACLTLGFKKTGLVVVALFGLVVVLRFIKFRNLGDTTRSSVPMTLLSLVFTGALLGLFGFAYNLAWFGNLFGALITLDTIGPSFFDFRQIIAYPLLLNMVPFSSNPSAVWVPWAKAYWYWPPTNLFFSHWGYVFNGLVLGSYAMAIIWAKRAMRGERTWILPLAGLGMFLLIVAKGYGYSGGFNSFARFTLFFSVILAVFMLWPAIWRGTSTSEAWSRFVYLGALGCFGISFAYYLVSDLYAPLQYAWKLTLEPSARRIVAFSPNRVPCMVDRLAGPRDVVATDLTYHTWLYPLYGADLQRPVHILRLEEGRFVIPPGTTWVLADNISTIVWNIKAVKNGGDLLHAFGTGTPTERDTLLFRQMSQDPAFKRVATDALGAQCIFRRKE